MEVVKIELNDGTLVYGKEIWNCCNGCNDCGERVEIYSTPQCRKKDYLCEIVGLIPNSDDYLLEDDEDAISYANAWNEFINEIESNI